MDDMLGKMGAILSDPESVQQLQELAQMLQQESGETGESPKQEQSGNADGESGGFDMGMLMRIQENTASEKSGPGGQTDETVCRIQCRERKRNAPGSAIIGK